MLLQLQQTVLPDLRALDCVGFKVVLARGVSGVQLLTDDVLSRMEEMCIRDRQGFVPSWSFLTCLRRPLLFRLAGKEGGEKGRLVTVLCFLHLNLGKHQNFRCRSTRESPYEFLLRAA